MELVGYSDSDWAGDPLSGKSQSSGHVEADGCALTSFSRRQSCVATSSGNGGVLRDVLDCGGTAAPAVGFSVVNTTLSFDSLAARGIAQRAGLEKVKVLAVKTLWLQEGLKIKAILRRQTRLTWKRKFYLWAD